MSGDLYLGASPDAIKAVPRCAGRVEGGEMDHGLAGSHGGDYAGLVDGGYGGIVGFFL